MLLERAVNHYDGAIEQIGDGVDGTAVFISLRS